MKLTTAFFLASVVAIAFGSAAFAQTKPAKPAIASTLPAHWDEIDQRFVFLTVQLASSETSLDAVNKALKVAGYHQKAQQQQAVMHEKGNEHMDRNGGGPVRWDQFYGKTAAQFFRTADAGFIVDDDTSLTVVTVQNGSGQRPPQFDYIYRANQNAQARAQEEVAKLGGQIDALLERRRQLELEQAATWAKIAFQAVESHKLEAKPTYRFVLNVDGDDALSKQRQTAVRAAADFMRETLRAVADAEDAVENDPAGTFDALHRVVAASASDFNDKVLHCPKLALDAGDASTSIGRVAASSQRLADVTKNITDSYHSAMEGDQSSDDQQKQTFRAYTQQALFDCATNVFTTSQYVTALAREWKTEIDVNKPQRDLPPSAVAKASSSADAKPQTAAVAANNAAVPGTSAAKPPIKLTRNLPQYLIATGTFAADAEGIRPAKKTVVATRSPDFLNKDFVFDVYLTIPKRDNDDSIIVGLGDLTDKGSVRIAIHREGGWGERAFLLPATNEHELIMGDIHEGEPYIVRIERHGSPLTISIGSMNNGQFVAEMTQTVPDLKDFAPDVSDKRAHLYFTGEGLFSQVRLVSGNAASAVATAAHAVTPSAPSADASPGAAQPSAAVDADAAKGIYLLNTDKLPAPFTATGTFSITPEGLKCYDTKSLIITHDKDFLSKDFIFEATVDVPDKLDRDEIIIGLGDGTDKGSLRMIIRVEGGWPKRAYLHLGEREGKNFGDIRDAGVRILRIERHGNTVTTSVGTEKDGKFDAEMSQTVADAKTAVPELSERYAHLFFTGKPPWSKIRLVTGAAASEPAPAPTQPDQPKKPGRKKR